MGKIKETEIPSAFSAARKTADAFGETNDCAVIAVSIATGIEYSEAHRLLKAAGRKDRKATPNLYTRKVIEALGYTVRGVDQRAELFPRLPAALAGAKSLTSGSARRAPGLFPRNKTYVCRSNGHIWCVKYGQVQDWSVNAARRIVEVWEVTPNEED